MSSAHRTPAPPVQTALHRLAPEVKVAAVIVFVVSEALVPRGVWWPYAIDAALLAGVAVWARASPALLGSRLLVELPFVAFVILLPFVGRGPDVDVLGVSVSRAGLILAGSIACKATLAVLATGVLAATTSPAAIVGGLGTAPSAGDRHQHRGAGAALRPARLRGPGPGEAGEDRPRR